MGELEDVIMWIYTTATALAEFELSIGLNPIPNRVIGLEINRVLTNPDENRFQNSL
jgi:hypothetical protein